MKRRHYITFFAFLPLVSCEKTPSDVPSSDPEVLTVVSYETTEMRYGDPSRHSYLFAKDPTVIHLGEEYRMYYSLDPYDSEYKPAGVNKEVANWHCAVARSTDIINWQRISDITLLNRKGEIIGYDAAPCVKIFDGVIHMFYQRVCTATGKNAIWHATSKDGITFNTVDDDPVVIPDNTWSASRAIDAEVYRVGDKMLMLYATRDAATGSVQQFGMSEAPYGSDYSPKQWKNVSKDGPVLCPTYGWEGKCCEAPSVMERDGVWYLFYAGSYNNALQQIGLCVSTDGYHFTRVKYDKNRPGLFYKVGPTGSWNAAESGHPGVFVDNDGKAYLFFQGKKSNDKGTADPYLLSVLKLSFSDVASQ